MQEKISQQKLDSRPFALSRGKDKAKTEGLIQTQIDYLEKFYNRHQITLINFLKTHHIKHDEWHGKIKPQIDLFQRYYWEEIYCKKHINSPQSKKSIINEKILEFTNKILESIHIDPTSILLKILTPTEWQKQKMIRYGTTTIHKEENFTSLASILQKYYIGNSDIFNIYYPVIGLRLSNNQNTQEIEFFNEGMNSILLREIGHAYLLHEMEMEIIGNKDYYGLQKFYEIEANCILSILNKKYAEIKLENSFKNCIGAFLIYIKNGYQEQDKLTYIFSKERPTHFENFIQIADVCEEVWDINVYNKATDVLNFSYPHLSEKQYNEIKHSIIQIDPQSEYYIPAVDPNFEFQVPRLQIPGKEVYNFMQQKN